MTDEAVVCAAAFFRSIGKDVTTPEEFVMKTSLEMKWMSPSDSKLLLKRLVCDEILVQKDGFVRPSKDLGDMDVPLAYRPSPEFMKYIHSNRSGECKAACKKEQPPDMFHILMDAAVKGGMQRVDFIRSSNGIQQKLGIDIGAAALIVLRDNGLDITPYVEDVCDSIRLS